MSAFRRLVLSTLEGELERRLVAFRETDWTMSAIVFAPHPDDETLGCGGVAAKKIAAGSNVRFVIVTDGAASHRAIAPDKLRSMREHEAVEAVVRLGGKPADVSFLRFPDGSAQGRVDEIAASVGDLLDQLAPECLFVPHGNDPPPDHRAVRLAVRQALDLRRAPSVVFEYPIWYWYHWPWVGLGGDLPRLWRPWLRQTVRTAMGLKSLRAFNTRAYVKDALPRKQAALAAHASQMERREDSDDWPILADVGRGEFLTRLLRDYEMFLRYKLHG